MNSTALCYSSITVSSCPKSFGRTVYIIYIGTMVRDPIWIPAYRIMNFPVLVGVGRYGWVGVSGTSRRWIWLSAKCKNFKWGKGGGETFFPFFFFCFVLRCGWIKYPARVEEISFCSWGIFFFFPSGLYYKLGFVVCYLFSSHSLFCGFLFWDADRKGCREVSVLCVWDVWYCTVQCWYR